MFFALVGGSGKVDKVMELNKEGCVKMRRGGDRVQSEFGIG